MVAYRDEREIENLAKNFLKKYNRKIFPIEIEAIIEKDLKNFETQANKFANNLLVPKNILLQKIENKWSKAKISRFFKVNERVVTIAVVDLMKNKSL